MSRSFMALITPAFVCLCALLVAGLRAVPVRAAPAGELLELTVPASAALPGPARTVSVHVPAGYTGERPACLYLGLGGRADYATAILERGRAAGWLPTTVAVFVAAAGDPATDSLADESPGDGLARFLAEELLPAVEKLTTRDGRRVRLSRAAADRAIGGVGTAAVAALNAAWERPGDWGRVFAADGAWVAGRGADRLPLWVRKREARPLRIALHGGEARDDEQGDRRAGHEALAAALTFAGNEVEARWSPRPRRAAARFAEALRWLWRGWPAPPRLRPSGNATLRELLLPGEDWQLVNAGYRFTEGPAVDARGTLFFNDIPAARTYRVGPDGSVAVFVADSQKANGQDFGPDGRLYAMTGGAGKVMAYDEGGRGTLVAEGFSGNDLVVARDGRIYVTSPPDARNPTAPSRILLVGRDGGARVVDTGLRYANGIALSPDESFLYADDHRSRWVYRFRIDGDGGLRDKQRFCALHVPETADDSSADGIAVDVKGRLYVATRTGLVQICDGAGRVVAILPTPNRRVSNLAFGGAGFDVLYATAGDRVWRRRLGTRGAGRCGSAACGAGDAGSQR